MPRIIAEIGNFTGKFAVTQTHYSGILTWDNLQRVPVTKPSCCIYSTQHV